MASLVTAIAALSRAIGTVLHPRENQTATANLGAANATVEAFCDGCGTVTLDLRGTFSLTVQVLGTVDGSNWVVIPIRPQVGGIFVASVAGTTSGTWMASCSGFTKVRAIVTSWTSGSATATLTASNACFDDFARNGGVSSTAGTNTGAAAAAVTLTLAAPGAGLRHYITRIEIDRVNGTAAALTASATPVVVTTTNLPGSMAFTFAADALGAGAADVRAMDFGYPVMSSAQNTATTIVCPATTGVIWRVSAWYYVAP